MLKTVFQRAATRIQEEQLYEIVAIEIDQGVLRPGLWAKAFAKSNGEENVAKANYIELRVQSLKDEIEVFTKSSTKTVPSSDIQKIGSFFTSDDDL